MGPRNGSRRGSPHCRLWRRCLARASVTGARARLVLEHHGCAVGCRVGLVGGAGRAPRCEGEAWRGWGPGDGGRSVLRRLLRRVGRRGAGHGAFREGGGVRGGRCSRCRCEEAGAWHAGASIVVDRQGRDAGELEARGGAQRQLVAMAGRHCRDSVSRCFAVHTLVVGALVSQCMWGGAVCRMAMRSRRRAAQPGQQSLDGTRRRSSQRCAVLTSMGARLGV